MLKCSTIRLSGGRLALLAGGLAVVLSASIAQAGPRWLLIHRRQVGNVENAGGALVDNHVFLENGNKAVGVGITNASNPGTNIFGTTNSNGFNRVNPLDDNNCLYDFRIRDGLGTPTDSTPDYYWREPSSGFTYSFIDHWLYVSDDTGIYTDPTKVIYDYDALYDAFLNRQINTYDSVNPSPDCSATNLVVPAGAGSDAKTYDSVSVTWFAQTFVIPDGINRIISLQAFPIRGAGQPSWTAEFSIHADNGGSVDTWPQVGPTRSLPMTNNTADFREQAANWALSDVVVTPGQTYALKVKAADGAGINAFRMVNNNYANGQMYTYDPTNGLISSPTKDLMAFIAGVGVNNNTPVLEVGPDPQVIEHTVTYGEALPSSDTFDIWNGWEGTLNWYLTNDYSGWITATPMSGSATTETDTVTLDIDTTGLPLGQTPAYIYISAEEPTANFPPPQSIEIRINVVPPPELCDSGSDEDFDGLVDCDDPDCFGDPVSCTTETNCGDGQDNDADSLIDCNDDDCDPLCGVGVDRLVNGNFDLGLQNVKPPIGWTVWGNSVDNNHAGAGDWSYNPSPTEFGTFSYRCGEGSQRLYSAGIYQTVSGLIPGRNYQLDFKASWGSGHAGHRHQVGISNGTDQYNTATLPGGLWSEENNTVWEWNDLTLEVTAASDTVTVWIKTQVTSATSWQPMATWVDEMAFVLLPSGQKPVLTGAVSRKSHGGAGNWDINVGAGNIECRSLQIGSVNPNQLLIVATFDIDVALLGGANDVTTDVGTVSSVVPGATAKELQITLTNLPFNTQVNLGFPGVVDATNVDPAYATDSTLCVRVIVGDYDNLARTNFLDFAKVKNAGYLNQLVTSLDMARADFDCNSRPNFLDFAKVKNGGLLNQTAPACPVPPIGP